jgi:hypothetical protein
MLNRILLLVALALTYLTISNCKGCKENPCAWEYEQENGVCKCPEGKYESVGLCRSLKPGEFFGKTTGCSCQDSAFFLVKEKKYEPNVGDTLVVIEKVTGVEDNPNLHTISLTFKSIYLPEGDSLDLSSIISPSVCPVQGRLAQSKFTAKYKGKDALKLYMFNQTFDPVAPNKYLYDTCVYILHK